MIFFVQLSEQQVYARARKFLRQLEIRFQESPQQLTRILNTFKAIAETGIYKEKEVGVFKRLMIQGCALEFFDLLRSTNH